MKHFMIVDPNCEKRYHAYDVDTAADTVFAITDSEEEYERLLRILPELKHGDVLYNSSFRIFIEEKEKRHDE